MSMPDDIEAAAAPVTTTNDAALFSTANDLLLQLTDRLTDRPHGQISLGQLPDVFVIRTHLEQLLELEAKKVKHQETLIQMAQDREEAGGKLSKKRIKTTGTQATIMRQAVAEEVESRTADLQRYTARLEDQAKRNEKLLETAINDIKRLNDQVSFLQLDVNKAAKVPKTNVQKSARGTSTDFEVRLNRTERLVQSVAITAGSTDSRLSRAEERLDQIFQCDVFNDTRHSEMVSQVGELGRQINRHYKHNETPSKNHDAMEVNVEKLPKTISAQFLERMKDQELAVEDLRDQANTSHARLERVVNVVNNHADHVNPRMESVLKVLEWAVDRLGHTADYDFVWKSEAHGLDRV